MSLKRLNEIRTRIGEIKKSLSDLKINPLPLADVHAAIDATVGTWACKFDDGYAGRAFSEPGAIHTPEVLRFACTGEEAKIACILAWFDPEGLREKLKSAAKPYAASKGIKEQDRPAIARKLEGELYSLETEEEQIVCQLEDDGVEVFRRPDADPSIILAAVATG